jgi:hypothetical protein
MPRITMWLFLAASFPVHAEHLQCGWQNTDGINLFYREDGRPDAPTIAFLHGNFSSSIMCEEVMANLLDAEDFHVLAVADVISLLRASFLAEHRNEPLSARP